jgi:hypothetical protein
MSRSLDVSFIFLLRGLLKMLEWNTCGLQAELMAVEEQRSCIVDMERLLSLHTENLA